jgi:hypothetical protein
MSWDVFVQHLPAGTNRVADIPDDYEPEPLGTRAAVIEKIKATLPDADFTDPTWGKLKRPDFTIDINMTDDDIISAITLHVRGSAAAVYAVNQIIGAVGGRGLDSWTGELFDPATGVQSLHRWQAYIDEL